MECEKLNLGGMSAILCGRGRPKCKTHGRPSEFQCDFPIGRYKSGKKKGQIRDCNRHLCSDCVMHGITPGVDFCKEHYPIAKAAYERRTKTKT